LLVRINKKRGPVPFSDPRAAMGMKCYKLRFLSLGIWGLVASPLPRRLIFPDCVRSVYSS